MIDFTRMRHFIAVADEMHFSRAAASLGIGQPQLSRSIAQLEQSLGARLFERGTRRIRLTASGELFLDEARRILLQVERATQIARGEGIEDLLELRIGVRPSAFFFKVLPAAMLEFRDGWPKVKVTLTEMGDYMQIAALHEQRIDIGFFDHIAPTENLETRVLYKSTFRAALPSSWPLAKRKSLKLKELSGLPFILIPHERAPKLHSALLAACRRAGFVPRIVQEVSQSFVMLSLVAGGVGVALIADAPPVGSGSGVTYVPIVDFPADICAERIMAWLPRPLPPAMRAMVVLVERKSSAINANNRSSLRPKRRVSRVLRSR